MALTDIFMLRYFHTVLDALVELYPSHVSLLPPSTLPAQLQDPKYAAFKNCLGATVRIMA
ncbi:uncharacterized protein VP01_1585g6 [Puccinia sorghi]|uniref:Uncharacterized protein n=1 Tax=Puccinia sorghi TaxID=27349 RepID=A0A0L6VHS3_9BASI|nr:uncharacterized protein VP01_1585g6 [Puccinia sorghi]